MYQYYYTQSHSSPALTDYSDKNEISNQAKDSVTFYADNSVEPVTLYSQYFADHQNDKMLKADGQGQLPLHEDQLEFLPVAGESQAVSNINRNQYKISLRSNLGQDEVVLVGDRQLFMKTIKTEIMNFLNDYQVPIATFCNRILNKNETSSFSTFFAINDWDLLTTEDKFIYYKLSSWVTEPVTKRMFDLIQKEADVGRKAQLTTSYVQLTTVPTQRARPEPASLSLNLPDVEITSVNPHRKSDGVSGHSPQYSGPSEEPRSETNAKESTVPSGPLRTVTTAEERAKIKQWGLQHLDASARERGDLARSMGVTKSTVDRIINYEKKMRGVREDQKNKEKSKMENTNKLQNIAPSIVVEQDQNNTRENIPNTSEMDRKVSNSEVDQEKVKAVIQQAVKSGSLKLNDMKKPIRIVVKTKRTDNQNEQEIKPEESISTPRTTGSPARNFKFNRIALDSYFKNKGNPTAEQIDYFVSCTQVPYEVTKAYLAERGMEMPTSAIVDEQTGGSTLSLSSEQRIWFENFLVSNPAPDVEAIIKFSKSIGMPFDKVATTLENWNFDDLQEDSQPSQGTEYDEILQNLSPEVASLLRDIHQFRAENFPAALETELRSMFGKKIFCTLENIKAFARARSLEFQDIYKKLTSSSDHVQLVSEETCRRLVATEEKPSEYYEEETGVKAEAPESPSQSWLTNNDLMFEQSDEDEESPRECEQENLKRKSPEKDFSPSKKQRVDENDSGYLTPDDVSQNSDLLSNIIMENIGEVNMLNDSLDLFNESIKNIDLLNEMYERVEDEDRSQLVDHLKPKPAEKSEDFEALLEEAMEGLKNNVDNQESSSPMEADIEHQSDLRKIFLGPFQNFEPTFQVIDIEQSFSSSVFQVSLSDGVESSNNFYFKTRAASELRINQMIKLKQLRYAASKICVESFQVMDHLTEIQGKPSSIEESYFRKIRSMKVDSFELSDIESPKTIMEYICLEENIRTFMERNGLYPQHIEKADTGRKQEILFKFCEAKVNVSSKILKILSKLLVLEKEDIASFIIDSHSKMENSSQMVGQDHSYFSLFQCLSNKD